MPDLVFLCHRIPYPPNKGEKIRAYQILKYLSRRFAVHLGCFVDDVEDMQHAKTLASMVESLACIRLNAKISRLMSVTALLSGEPLSVRAFANSEMKSWTRKTHNAVKPSAIFVYSSAMAQYVNFETVSCPVIMDFVDVDSDKWMQYAADAPWPLSWLYRREARTLLEFDRRLARQATASLFVSEAETQLFRTLAPESAEMCRAVSNGIDCEFFSPDRAYPSPYSDAGPVLVFTGTMDYRPNVDAVMWFADEIFPYVRKSVPNAMFAIVGAKPAAAVTALAKRPGIMVTGRVDDVRPYIHHAKVVVAPLRLARGIQNKVLEGMAMGKPVVTTPQGLEGIEAEPGKHVLVGETAAEFAEHVINAISPDIARRMGPVARQLLVERYSWPGQLAAVDACLP
ncbi:MAG: TIGR03087 family PEP-CTERM/XrtA system glycosyltransferase [Rhodobacteraceae bacterium]|nr:TIGR03087 family PEP-CTERM/XrtA system glycosyltransferase [Paracoccaceae bacterium]